MHLDFFYNPSPQFPPKTKTEKKKSSSFLLPLDTPPPPPGGERGERNEGNFPSHIQPNPRSPIKRDKIKGREKKEEEEGKEWGRPRPRKNENFHLDYYYYHVERRRLSLALICQIEIKISCLLGGSLHIIWRPPFLCKSAFPGNVVFRNIFAI